MKNKVTFLSVFLSLMFKFLVFVLFFATQNYFSQDSINESFVEPVIINYPFKKLDNRKKQFVNISTDKEFALLKRKYINNCSLKSITVDVMEFIPDSDFDFFLNVRFYKNVNGVIGEELDNARLLVKLPNKVLKNVQVNFDANAISSKIQDESFFIGVNVFTVAANKSAVVKIFSSFNKEEVMYIRNNKINFWPDNAKLIYSKSNSTLFPSLNLSEKCTP